MSIKVEGVTKRFGKFLALNDVELEVPGGSLVALLGPSGSGKTTLLRIIAGLEVPDGGAVLYEGEDVTRHSARDRNVGFVFQHYALFRHLSVFENVAFGLRVRRWPPDRADGCRRSSPSSRMSRSNSRTRSAMRALGQRRTRRPKAMFSNTLRCRNRA